MGPMRCRHVCRDRSFSSVLSYAFAVAFSDNDDDSHQRRRRRLRRLSSCAYVFRRSPHISHHKMAQMSAFNWIITLAVLMGNCYGNKVQGMLINCSIHDLTAESQHHLHRGPTRNTVTCTTMTCSSQNIISLMETRCNTRFGLRTQESWGLGRSSGRPPTMIRVSLTDPIIYHGKPTKSRATTTNWSQVPQQPSL